MDRNESQVSMHGDRGSDEIRRDIGRTRADMDETIDALGRKLSPGQVLDEVWSRMKSGDTGTNFGRTISDHPVPLAMMGLGLAWLAIEKSREGRDRHVGEGTYARASGRVGPYRGEDALQEGEWDDGDSEGRLSGMKDRVSGAASRLGEAASHTADATREKAHHLRERAGEGMEHLRESAGDLSERAGETVARASDRTRVRARQAGDWFSDTLDQHPLAMGAVSFGLGLAAGLALPTTHAEDRLMGETSDTLKEETRHAAEELAQGAARAASAGVRTAARDVNEQGLIGDVGERFREVAQHAKDAARETAEREGLTGEGLAEKGRGIGQATRESARESVEELRGERGRTQTGGMSGSGRTGGTGTPGTSGTTGTTGTQGSTQSGSAGGQGTRPLRGRDDTGSTGSDIL